MSTFSPGPVCGIYPDQDLRTVSDEQLRRLQALLGREGSLNRVTYQIARRIERVLGAREAAGVVIGKEGVLQHSPA
ncbi:hypothetical protein H6786_02840 [Candidatus Nomurabacteria bacterium]|nr:hypothetical protein [Candidatus Nomurabacteria bacterium]